MSLKSIEQLLERIDVAIEAANGLRRRLADSLEAETLIAAANRTLSNLEDLRETVRNDKLPHPSKGETPAGAGLGLSRHIGDWTDDEALLSAVREVERFYRTRY